MLVSGLIPPSLPVVERIYAPGEIEDETRQGKLRDGIEIPPQQRLAGSGAEQPGDESTVYGVTKREKKAA